MEARTEWWSEGTRSKTKGRQETDKVKGRRGGGRRRWRWQRLIRGQRETNRDGERETANLLSCCGVCGQGDGTLKMMEERKWKSREGVGERAWLTVTWHDTQTRTISHTDGCKRYYSTPNTILNIHDVYVGCRLHVMYALIQTYTQTLDNYYNISYDPTAVFNMILN